MTLDDEPGLRGDLVLHSARLRELEKERDRLLVELRDALQQVEYWRTLAEYRQATLLTRELEDPGKRHQPRWVDYLF